MEIYIKKNSEEEEEILSNPAFMNVGHIKEELENKNFIGVTIIDNKIYSVIRRI